MANRRKTIARKAGISDHFLISQADHRRSGEIPAQDGRTRELLAPAYPELPVGEGLRRLIVARTAPDAPFAVTVLGPAAPPAGADPAANAPEAADPLPRIAAGLDGLCGREDGFWGVEDGGLLAAVWPGRSAADALHLARRLQEELAAAAGCQVRVGVAEHPTLEFPPQAALDNARKALDHAAFFGPDSRVVFDAVSLNISGDALYERGDVPAAVAEFRHGLELDPGSVNLHNSLGVCYAVLKDYDRAVAEFTAALRLQPDDHMAVYNLGLVHALLGRREAALGFFLRANELRGDVFEILLQTGKLHLDMGQPQSARPLFEHAARLRSKSGSIYRILGDCYTAVGAPEKAINAYKKAVKANPSDVAALSALGCLFDEKGENPEIALVFCRESARLAPDNALFRARLGALYRKMNRLEEALAEYERAAALGHDAAAELAGLRERLTGHPTTANEPPAP
jgi:tetratricopeptide (TPR) repeat protein